MHTVVCMHGYNVRAVTVLHSTFSCKTKCMVYNNGTAMFEI